MPLASALISVAALVGVAVLVGVLWRVRDGRRRHGTGALDLAELGVRPGRVALVQFTTETCARCPQVRRMLQGLASALAAVDLVEVDLTHRPDLARRHHVLSTPTTFLVDADATLFARFNGVPRRVDVEAALSDLPALQETP
ncbi:TlpA family protein disulfide reductase [Microbacterium sp. NPDC058342]|uniref:TlpA family protein disulfide reductase n=1 Tax=Microbacterium sp. NPDC058342 TaxID=3346454 RepID=UPI0036642E14